MPENDNEVYLGDGLYAEHQGYQVRVYASNGVRTSDEVFLELPALKRLVEFLREKEWKL